MSSSVITLYIYHKTNRSHKCRNRHLVWGQLVDLWFMWGWGWLDLSVVMMVMMMMMMIDVLRPLLCTRWAKWAKRPPKRSERWNKLQICPRGGSNSGGSDLWSNSLPVRPRKRRLSVVRLVNIRSVWADTSKMMVILRQRFVCYLDDDDDKCPIWGTSRGYVRGV